MKFEYPIQWPLEHQRTPAHDRQCALWSSNGKQLTLYKARTRLLDEIRLYTRYGHDWRIDPDDVVICSDMPVRQDGEPMGNRRQPDDPGIVVYLDLDEQPYCFPCDAWNRIEDNIAAVAAHLSALRAMERWRVGDLHRSFAGFKGLPNPDKLDFRAVLGVTPDECDLKVIEAAWRILRRERHPDRGGSDTEFNRINKAWEQAQEALG